MATGGERNVVRRFTATRRARGMTSQAKTPPETSLRQSTALRNRRASTAAERRARASTYFRKTLSFQ
jgi:hypothetical protein